MHSSDMSCWLVAWCEMGRAFTDPASHQAAAIRHSILDALQSCASKQSHRCVGFFSYLYLVLAIVSRCSQRRALILTVPTELRLVSITAVIQTAATLTKLGSVSETAANMGARLCLIEGHYICI
jgi:hypothetical protein